MDRFAAARAFVTVVEAGGFAPAARRLGLATSSVTRQVDALEARLGTTLVNRSTRRVALTDAGQAYYAQVVRVLGDLEAADLAVTGAGGAPRGVLRVSAPVAFGRLHLAPLLPAFLARYPEVTLDLLFSDAVVDLVAEDIDVAVRLGTPASQTLIARRLAPHARVACASPAYLDRWGVPAHPADLANHDCLTLALAAGRSVWRFAGAGGVEEVAVAGPMRANGSEPLVEAALAGLGLILMPTWLVGDHICAGRLRPVLDGWQPAAGAADAGIHAVYLANRRGAPKVRTFVDFLLDHWHPDPPWDAP